MSLNQLKIGMHLGIGFGAVLLLMALFSLLSVDRMGRLAEQTDKLYRHPFSVTRAALRIDANVAKLGQAIEGIQDTRDADEVGQALKQIEAYKAAIGEDFELALERYLGEKKDIETARQDYLAWAAVLDQEIVLLQDHSREAALREARKRTIAERETLDKRIQWTADFGENLAQKLVEDVKADASADAAEVAERIYRHPFAVGRAILRIDANVGKMRIARHQMQATDGAEERTELERQIKAYETAINSDFDLIMERFLGDKNEIAKTRETYASWHQAMEHEVGLLLDDSRERALRGLEKSAAEQRALLDKSLAEFLQFARSKAEAFVSNAGQVKTDSIAFTYLVLFAVLAVSVGLALWIARGIVLPLGKAVALSRQLAEGNLAARAEVGGGRDETAQLLRAMNEMAGDLQAVISETRAALTQLAEGNQRGEIRGQFIGDFVEIKDALHITARKLADATEKNEIQSWLKTGQAQLNEKLSGNQSLQELAENIIHFLVPYLNSQVGAIYLLENGEDGEPRLRLFASHAYTRRKTAATTFKFGEGLVGEAAFERTLFMVSQPPEDYLQIQSGLGAGVPKAILVTPFMHENELKGVLELASFEPFTDLQMDFLRQVMPTVGVAISTAESRTRVQVLLAQSQEQTRQLQKQTEQLELQQTSLQQANEELQSQSEELQAQTEELQTQQEELRQTNEELEERTKELERQKEAVNRQNADLEKAQAVVQAKAEELALASKYKSEFLANMSHELRTPLNSLLILSQLLADNKDGKLSDKQVEYARTIYSSGSDLLTLINEILDLSKVEAGKIELRSDACKIGELVAGLEQKFRHVAEDRGLYFNIKQAGKLPETLYTDAQRLKQVLNNLLSNAFKFTHQGGITLEVRRPEAGEDLSRSGLDPAKSIAICVSDTGIGIPKDKQKVIFEAFQQADGSTSRKYGGTGLGLSISRQLVQLMGGEVQLRSAPDQGSRFSVFLPEKLPDTPLAPTESPSAGPPAPPASTPPASTPPPAEEQAAPAPAIADDRDKLTADGKSILIVEDDPGFARILLDLAREKGFLCLLAQDGRTGLRLAEQYRPKAVILDIGLPQVDGWTVMERLKDNPDTRHIPVHFVSGTDHRQDARRMGAIGYSLKPVSMAELGETFKKITQFIDKHVKNLLLVTDSEAHRQAVLDALGDGAPEISHAASRAEALRHLAARASDCIVLDVELENGGGLGLLEKLAENEQYAQIPVLLYTERELSAAEDAALKQYAQQLTLKAVHSPECLLDETTLFLHQVAASLPSRQQQMLRMAHDKEALFKDKKVLIVDDDMRNTFSLSATLEDKGLEVLVAGNGREALACLDKEPGVALVLMDIMMPEMDGYEAMQKIREQARFRKLPIIALTAKAMKGDRAKCIEAGASDYLAKPIDTDKLLSLMRVWLYQ